ncbi:MAG: EAL domain-containing protein [Silicimonas sp.]|nr:EAL domain-containing protein [Silicimonas sp.]
MTEIQLLPGEILYVEGDSNDSAYIIASGEIRLYSAKSNGKDHERRGPGSIVGEFSILTNQPRAVTVEAVTHCRAFKIPAADIIERFEKLDPVLRACIETSIGFAGNMHSSGQGSEAPYADSTLSNGDELIAQFEFELDIKNGLRAGEFFMQFQPIVHVPDGRIVGFESLMRWRHPTKGVVPPDRFIPVAESMGSINDLTEFAIIETCGALREVRKLAQSPDPPFASVNISGKDIDRPGFVDFLAHALDLHSLHPSSLKLEVTETALVPNSEQAATNLEQMRAMGVGISVDDFGTGYSNFAYLKSLPLTALKIDRTFISDIIDNTVSRSIVRMLVGLGQELGVDIVAEGLETQEGVRIISELRCRYAQGYYFSKPLMKDDLIAMVLRECTDDQRGVACSGSRDRTRL